MTSARFRGRGPRDEVDPSVPRLFVAVPLAEEARASVERLVQQVRGVVDAQAREPRSEVRWVRLDGLHLTLRFLGPTAESRIESLANAVDRIAAETSRFRVAIRGAGAFPSPSRPRTLWLGLAEGERELATMTAELSRSLAADGWPIDDRPYRAHLTVARSDGRREGPLVARTLIEQAAGFDAAFDATRVVLFESLTGGGPARYVARHEAAIRN